MTNPTISADSNEALVWLKTQCELSGKREFKGDARAMLRAIRQAEQAAYERAAQFIADKAKLYPTHIFLEPKRGEHGKTVDGCSAAALRTMAPIWAEEVSALAQQPEEVE